MGRSRLRVVLDTNILISSFNFGGKPRQILFEVLNKKIVGITSEILVAELIDILGKKFKLEKLDLQLIDFQIRKYFKLVVPRKTIKALKDDDDNRVLEAAVEGNCNFIVTGDRGLLKLRQYRKVKILSPSDFLDLYQQLTASD